MSALLISLSIIIGVAIALLVSGGPGAVLVCAVAAASAWFAVNVKGPDRSFLLRLFLGGLLARVLVGTAIYLFDAQEFFGPDALTYDYEGHLMLDYVNGIAPAGIADEMSLSVAGRGMAYLVAIIYGLTGRNMLAVQLFNAALGATTALLIFLCAQHIFGNARVARIAATLVAFFPSLVLWSSQGLKDGPVVFLLAATMLATLKLGERLSVPNLMLLIAGMLATLTLRFYIFYMLAAAVVGSFVVGMRAFSAMSLARQVAVVFFAGLALTYVGVLRTASTQMESYGSLESVQRSRADLAGSANTGFGKDADVSTASGALTVIPLGMAYLLFAPFPWQIGSVRQLITFPEMLVWWASFPLIVSGLRFTLRFRLRQAMPILLFTTMLTFAYSIFQGNVGTAYRQRSQLLVFYFIFAAVGAVLLREKSEDRERARRRVSEAAREQVASLRGARVVALREGEPGAARAAAEEV